MSSSLLTPLDIESLVNRYREAMVRYEEAALAVESRIRREMRAEAVRVLLSSRAKHPEEVRAKLVRKGSGDNPPTLAQVEQGLNRVLTDLAGVRVIVYDPGDEARVFDLARRKLPLVGGSEERKHSDERRYRAHHLLVEIDESFDRPSILGTVVEVQVAAIASHVFNEIEHDIVYKDKGVEAGQEVRSLLDEVYWASRLLDVAVHRLVEARLRSIADATEPLREAAELRRVLERRCDRVLTGDFVRLFQLLNAVSPSLTVSAVEALGDPRTAIEHGKAALGLAAEDVTGYAVGVAESDPDLDSLFRIIARSWRGPASELKRAILRKDVDV